MKKNAIQQAALSIFSRKGYSGTSIQEIADKVGINKATLYFYFENKAELYLSILKDHTASYVDGVRTAVESNSDQILERILFSIVKAFSDNSDQERLLLWKFTLLMVIGDYESDILEPSKDILIGYNNAIESLIQSVISSKSNASEVEQADFIAAFYVFLQGFLDWILTNNYTLKRDVDAFLNTLWAAFWNGCSIA